MSSKPPYRTINPLTAVRINQKPKALNTEDNSPQKYELLRIVALREDYKQKRAIAEQLPTSENVHAVRDAKKLWLDSCRIFALENKGLAVASAIEHSEGPEPSEDLIQAAFFGLFEAIQRFDPTKANRISSFAVWRMLYRCQEALGKSTQPVHIDRAIKTDAGEVGNVEESWRLQKGELPSDEELLDELAKKEERDNKKKKKPRQPKWVGEKAMERLKEARTFSTASVVFDEEYRSRSREVYSELSLEDLTDLSTALAILSPAMRAVIANEYGVGELNEQDLPPNPLAYDITLTVALTRLRKVLG